MSWMNEQNYIWRTAGLVLLLVAIAGPWGFDRIHVPAEYPCSAPNVRLEGDFCGLPLSMTWSLQVVFGDLRGLVRTLIDYPLAVGPTLLLLLPVASTLLLLLPGTKRLRRLFHRAALGLGLLVGLAGAVSGFFLANWALSAAWVLWGLWLYVAVVIIMLAMDGQVLAAHKPPATANA